MTPPAVGASLLERAAARYALLPGAARIPVPADVAAVLPVQGEPAAASRPFLRVAAIDRVMLAERGMIVPGAAVTALAEEFRLVKRQLLLTARTIAETNPRLSRSILVCSAAPDDGKTFCAINLALSLAAEKDMEILLVDGDFGKPDVLSTLGIETDGPGLLDALADPAVDVEDCIVTTDVPQLSVLPCGTRTHGDTELLTSDHARTVLDRLAGNSARRIVIYDSPPALAASPASVLAGQVGQVILVVRADRTSEADLRDAVALLDGCSDVQLLLNAVAFQTGGRRYGNYYEPGPA